MAANRIYTYFGRLLVASIAVTGLLASEHHGFLKSGGLPVPGATVTATMGDKKIVTTSDEQRRVFVPRPGGWHLDDQYRDAGVRQADQGSRHCTRRPAEPRVGAEAAFRGSHEGRRRRCPGAPHSARQRCGHRSGARDTFHDRPPTPAPPTTSAAATPTKPRSTGTRHQQPAERQQRQKRQQRHGANGRPSIRQSLQQRGTGFQRANVNTTGDAGGAEPGPVFEYAAPPTWRRAPATP